VVNVRLCDSVIFSGCLGQYQHYDMDKVICLALNVDIEEIIVKVLSIIIPSYNSENYLDKAILSMLHPEVLDKLDIIVVNDGSTDKTAEVAEKYCQKYPNSIHLISQENKGHGGALNTGCAAAVGKYLKVIDADDWMETENLSKFVQLLEECESDVVLTHHYTRDISTGEVKRWKSYPKYFNTAYTLEEIMQDWKGFDRSLTFHGITYKTEFYHTHCILFSEHVFYEDHEYATFPCCHAKSITPFDIFIYDYRIGDVAQSVSEENQLKRSAHTETVLNRIIQEYSALPELPEGGKAYIIMKAQALLLSYLTTQLLVERDRKKGRVEAAKIMRKAQKDLPSIYDCAEKKYRVFLWMNRLHMTKQVWDRVLSSGIYNKLRNNHDFS